MSLPAERDQDPSRPPRVAVVGHTNTGKTSLLRTLLRDATFGEVSDRPATTRHAERVELVFGEGSERGRIAITDTPGLEDSSGLMAALEADHHGRGASDGHERVQRWLETGATPFEQEGKAIRQVLDADLSLYVIDARDRVLGRHRDELTILSWCAKPIVPVLNFVASPEADLEGWRTQLARLALHAVVAFDTVSLDEASERQLFEAMRTLAPAHQRTFDACLAWRLARRDERIRASARSIAELLIDAAASVVHVDPSDAASVRSGVERLRGILREREERCVAELIEIHHFRADDRGSDDLPVVDGRFGLDLFHPQAMRQLGLTTGRGAAIGAMAGLAVDALVGGMTLGAAAATGAGLGAALETARGYGGRWVRRVRGETELRADDATIQLLHARAVGLAEALLRRGHAAPTPLGARPGGLLERVRATARSARGWSPPEPIQRARVFSNWSSASERRSGFGLAELAALTDPRRSDAVRSLARSIEAALRSTATAASSS